MLLVMSPLRRSLRVLHTADVHLESDGYGDARQQVLQQARGRRVLSRIVDRALSDQVDLLLIAGDLFDHNRVSDEAVDFVRAELARLARPVVILPGNHDALYTNAIYDRHDLTAGASDVRVIRRLNGEVVELPELDAVVWGRAMEEHEPGFQPLARIPGRAIAAGTSPWRTASSTHRGSGPIARRRSSPTRSAIRAGTTSRSATTTSGPT